MNLFNRLFNRIDENLQNNKSTVRKIRKSGNSYVVSLPPFIIEKIVSDYETDCIKLSLGTLDNEPFIMIKPCTNKIERRK
jgi:antitoxin component of MazEF toxin-antitoxin module